MSIVFADDSDGYTHQIWAQRQANSCAVASIWMARGQAMQMTFNEGEWQLAWRMYGQVVQGMALVGPAPAPMSLDPSSHPSNQSTFENMFASFGTYMGQVAAALGNEGLKATATAFSPGSTVDVTKLSETTPAIVLLGWYSGATRNGGHFIVASKTTSSGKVVYLDPWGGVLRELGAGPGYPGGGRFESVCYVSA